MSAAERENTLLVGVFNSAIDARDRGKDAGVRRSDRRRDGRTDRWREESGQVPAIKQAMFKVNSRGSPDPGPTASHAAARAAQPPAATTPPLCRLGLLSHVGSRSLFGP